MAYKNPPKKDVDHKLPISSWMPRVPNRGEPLDFDHYGIFIALKEARISLYFKDKDNNELVCKVDGPIDEAYSEAIKKVPNTHMEDFKESWTNTKLDYIFSGTQLVNKISKPNRKKPDFKVGNKTIEIKVDRSKKEVIDLGYFNYKNENQILADKIRESELDISQIAEKVGLHVSMVSKQMKGQRDITRDHAFKYAKFFGCDPADIMFAAPQVPIWSTVNFLDFTKDQMPFNPGECIAVTDTKRELVVCPRDIYRPDIKAIKVNSSGSYLDGMVLFYYATSDVKQDCLGRLSIIGDDDGDDELMEELRYGEKQRYYVGILEQYKGQLKLLNPDPYATESKVNNGIVIKNFTPTFASPIVGIVNPNQIKKDKHSSKLFKHNDEIFRLQRQMEEQRSQQENIVKLEVEKAAAKAERVKKELNAELEKQIKQLEQLNKKIEQEKKNKLFTGIGSLFYGQEQRAGLLDFEDLKQKRINKK